MQHDPDEVKNLLSDEHSAFQSEYFLADRPFNHVVNRLDALLMVLKSCYGEDCHEPWSVIHPDSKIKHLKHALDPSFDKFYEDQPKVAFSSCQMGYLRDEEGPQDVNVWAGEQTDGLTDQQYMDGTPRSFRYQGHWSWYT